MATTSISVCNTALVIVGAEEINTFDDATTEAKLANSVYTDTKNSLLQAHPWRFSLKQVDLGGRLTDIPEFDWSYQFQLPPDALRVIAMKDSADYEIYQDKLYTDQTEADIIYQADTSESDMPSYFIRCLQYQLAKLFAISLQEDTSKMQLFEKLADKEITRARNIDAQQQPNTKIPAVNFSLINVRG